MSVYSSDSRLLAQFYDEYRVPVILSEVPRTTIAAVLASEAQYFTPIGNWMRKVSCVQSGRISGPGNLSRAEAVLPSNWCETNCSIGNVLSGENFAKRFWPCGSSGPIPRKECWNTISIYLIIYLGDGAYGIQAAVESYFHKFANRLKSAEGAMPAGIIRSLGQGNPRENFAVARRRQREILAVLLAHKQLSLRLYRSAITTCHHISAPQAILARTLCGQASVGIPH